MISKSNNQEQLTATGCITKQPRSESLNGGEYPQVVKRDSRRRKIRTRNRKSKKPDPRRINFEGRDARKEDWYDKKQKDRDRNREKLLLHNMRTKPASIGRTKPHVLHKFDSTKGYPGEGPAKVTPPRGKGKASQGKKKEKGPPECIECALGLACKTRTHWHWANNKGKGDHAAGAKTRILRNKPRPAVRCKYTIDDPMSCPNLNCHCHPKSKKNASSVASFGHPSAISASSAIDESLDVVSFEDVALPKAPVEIELESTPEEEAVIAAFAAALALKLEAAKAEKPAAPLESKEEQRHNADYYKRSKCNVESKSASCDSGRREPSAETDSSDETSDDETPPLEDDDSGDEEKAYLHTDSPLPTPHPTVIDTTLTGIDAASSGVPALPSGLTSENSSPVNIAPTPKPDSTYVCRTSTTTIFHNGKGMEETGWRTISEFGQDARFWILSHVSSVNPQHQTNEDEQLLTSTQMTTKRATTLRRPTAKWTKSTGLTPRWGVTFGMTKKSPMRERFRDVTLNMFEGTYTHASKVQIYPYLYNLLMLNPDLLSKRALDAGGDLRSTFPARLKEMLKKEEPELLAMWLADSPWTFEYTIASFTNHAVLTSLFSNTYTVSKVLVDKPMLNGLKVPSSVLPRSKNLTA